MKYRSLILFTVLLLVAFVAFGQSVVTAGGSGGNFTSFMLPPSLPPAITGAPYSGEETQEITQTLSDGTHITQRVAKRTMYRDSFGRTRVERTIGMAPRANVPQPPTIIEITDPVAGAQYVLDMEHKVAHRVSVQAQSAGGWAGNAGAVVRNSPWFAETLSAGPVSRSLPNPPNAVVRPADRSPEVAEEKLGTQIIEGLAAEGERHTTTIPEGEQGNDQPLHVAMETWTSPDLKMVVLQKSSDPRSGEMVMKVTNISRSEPDASLFQPPPDYTVVEESAQFTIHYGN